MRYTVALHERVWTVTDNQTGHSRAPKTANRGTIKGISSKSRYRLIRILAQISRPDEPVFITLTYRNFTDDFATWKRHLHNFRRVLADDFPEYCGLWRLEFQERGAPHFHILAWLVREVGLEALQARLKTIWCRVIGQTTAANLEFGCTVEPVTDFRRTAFYISLYQSKDSQDRKDIDTGREWGVWKRERLGLEPVSTVTLTATQFQLLRRTVRRNYENFLRRSGKGFTTSGAEGSTVVRGYLRALRRDQPFTNFLPYHQARKLVEWVSRENPF
jgi:hypothetical protein